MKQIMMHNFILIRSMDILVNEFKSLAEFEK